jgi:hypothetical protein
MVAYVCGFRCLRAALPGLLAFGLAGCQSPEPETAGIQISESGSGAYEVAMTAYRDGAALAWYDTRDGNAELYLRLIDSHGQPSGPEHRLTSDADESYAVSIAALGDALAVAWYAKDNDDTLQAHIGAWDPVAGWRWRRTPGRFAQSRNPVIAAHGETIFCAWIEAAKGDEDKESVYFGFWRADGTMLSEPQPLGAAGAQTWNLNAALDTEDRAFVVFDAPDADNVYELFAAEVGAGGAKLFQLSASDGFASKYPDIAISSESTDRLVALTWFDERDGNEETYLSVMPLAELGPGKIDAFARRLSYSRGSSIGSYVAWSGGHIGVAWSDMQALSHDVFLQYFDGDAVPLGPAMAVTNSDGDSLIPAIEPWADGFAVAWNELAISAGGPRDADGSEVYFAEFGGLWQP